MQERASIDEKCYNKDEGTNYIKRGMKQIEKER